MTSNHPANRCFRQWFALPIATMFAVSVLGGCALMFPSHHHAAGPAAEPLSDVQARAQVVEPAKQLTRAAELQVTYVTFAWEWCNDQGKPPYHGRVDMVFKVPDGVDRGAYFKQITATMVKQSGWGDGPPPGMQPFGETLHKEGVMITIGPGNYPRNGTVELYGECRNLNDHRDDSGWHDITDEVTGS